MTTQRPRTLSPLRWLLPLLGMVLVAACGGGGGGECSGGSGARVTISGKITFDRVPFKVARGSGLDFGGIVPLPARDVVVEAVQPGNVLGGEKTVDSTTTDATGAYSLSVPANTIVFIRAKAQMLKEGAAPTWDFKVLNNTNSDALYVLDGGASCSSSANTTRDLRATSGWGTSSYIDTRSAAPFAILDTIYQFKELIRSVKADTAFPALDLFWSVTNKPATPFCPDTGDIVSSLYTTFSAAEPNDSCSTPTPGRDGIYILGDFDQGDTDEFDQHVIAHEVGHYFEDRFSRSDSIGGDHGINSKLDLRVAFGEGWGDAFGAMVLNDPVYRDSNSGASADFGVNLESDVGAAPGWFSEFSTFKILWDIFDGANEANDTVALGFRPIYNVMMGAQASTGALTGIFPFVTALKAVNPSEAPGINALLVSQGIVANVDDFATAESNTGGDATVIPIYNAVAVPSQVNICSTGTTNGYNKLGNRKFLRLSLGGATSISIVSTGSTNPLVANSVAALDPDIIVWRRGTIFEFGVTSPVPNEVVHRETLSSMQFPAGEYVIEIYDSAFVERAAANSNPHCMTVSIAG